MYLEGRRYVSGYEHSKPEEQEIYRTVLNAIGMSGVVGERSLYVNFMAMSWRKSNQIHNWFVTNVQSGIDDCTSYEVTREQLGELIDLCERVGSSGDPAYAEEHLPTGAGFFFGSIEYGTDYFEDVDDTARRLADILTDIPKSPDYMTNVTFHYSSSW
jgi:hypothetical protein